MYEEKSDIVADKNERLMICNTPVMVIPEKRPKKITLSNIGTIKVPYRVEKDFHEVERVLEKAYSDIQVLATPAAMPKRPLNYRDKWERSAYILRYLYAYIYEYINMFVDLLDIGAPEEELSMLSIGCGAKLDAWAFQEALKVQRTEKKVRYIGIDREDWSGDGYCLSTEDIVIDEGTQFNCFAGEYFNNCQSLDYDVYLFPKSIGDIFHFDRNGVEFYKIKHAFETKAISKDVFYLAASMIKYDDDSWDDIEPLEELIKSIEKNGMKCTACYINGIHDIYIMDSKNYVRYAPYPEKIYSEVEKLTGYKPTTSRKRERYVICKFEKVR